MWSKIKHKWNNIRPDWLNWWEIKWSVWAFFKYFKIVITMRPWDYAYILQMMKFQLEILKHNIFKGNEISDHKLIKIGDIERCVELIDNLLEHNYIDRCEMQFGEKLTAVFDNDISENEKKMNNKICKASGVLEEKEWNELINILRDGNYIKKRRKFKGGLRSWWN